MKYADKATQSVSESSQALIALGQALIAERYEFVTVTPDTHARVNARAARLGLQRASSLRDVFGWSRPFDASLLSEGLRDLMQAADVLSQEGDLWRSRVRFSSLGGRLFVHSAFPTQAADSVFFGPDTYRFCALLDRWASKGHRCLVDVGCGSGVGGVHASARADRVVLADINSRALNFARVNAALASVDAEAIVSDVLGGVSGAIDLVIANPPYMQDGQRRAYRDGGGSHGEALSVRIVDDALSRLGSGGMLILYTGSAIVQGVDTFLRSVTPLLNSKTLDVTYEELDPDVFGEELELPAYEDVDRIAAVGLRVSMR